MSNAIPGNNKHLTLADRRYIEDQLNQGTSFKDIARFLCKDPTTISKEVKLHRKSNFYKPGMFYNEKNHCAKRFKCKRTNACGKIILCDIKCSSCPSCNLHCPGFEKERCNRIDRAPYVCNGCDKRTKKCTIAHRYEYSAVKADKVYHETLSNSRAGINLSEKELRALDKIVSPLILQGQTPYQIVANHPELKISVRTLYTYINDGLLCARNIDLPRKPKFKPRKCHKTQITNREVFYHRTYTDFQELGLEHFIEMDTVHSSRDSKKALLTFFFTEEKLFLSFLITRNTKTAVKGIFNKLEKRLGTYDFLRLFEYILTDRGSEFGDPDSLETGINGFERCSIYYCDPMRSGQKGGIEQSHTLLRRVLPKGSNFEFLTQWDMNLINSHINSTPRDSLGGRTPYDVALEHFGEDVLNAFQLRRIDPDKVSLSPKLIRYTK